MTKTMKAQFAILTYNSYGLSVSIDTADEETMIRLVKAIDKFMEVEEIPLELHGGLTRLLQE